MASDDGEWHMVNRKKNQTHLINSKITNGRMDIATSGYASKEATVSFYFSEFPDSHGAKEMLRAFALYGKIVEVVIPPRRNKSGKRFGFARFANVQDPRMFAVKLDNIIFGATKIHVNLPRFVRNKQEGEIKRYVNGAKPKHQNRMEWRRVAEGGEGGETKRTKQGIVNEGTNCVEGRKGEDKGENVKEKWKEKGSWMGWQKRNQPEQKVVYYRKKNLCDVWYNAAEENINKFKKMYVVTVKNAGSAHMVQEWFNMQGFFSIKVTPLGANLVLLEEVEDGIIPALVSDAREWINEHFDGIKGWSPYDLDKERVVWIRCHGIPVHAWNNEFFSMLAGKFGTFLGVDENTRKKNSMDVARILLRTSWYDVFNMVVYANINGDMFHIKVLEEWCGPMHWEGLSQAGDVNSTDYSSGSDHERDDGDGPPLFVKEEEVEEFADEEESEGVVEKSLVLKTASTLEGKNSIINEVFNQEENYGDKEKINSIRHGDVQSGVNEVVNHGEDYGDKEKINSIMHEEVQSGVNEDHGEKEKSNTKSCHVGNEKAAPIGVVRSQQLGHIEDCGSGVDGEAEVTLKQVGVMGPNDTMGHCAESGEVRSGPQLKDDMGSNVDYQENVVNSLADIEHGPTKEKKKCRRKT